MTGHPGLFRNGDGAQRSRPQANQPAPPAAFLPLTCKGDVPVGAYEIHVIAKATVNGKEVKRFATVGIPIKAGLNGLPFPPREMLTSIGVAVTDKPLFSLTVKLAHPDVIRGVAANVTVMAKRSAGFAEEIQLAPAMLPPNVAIAAKPIPKGENEVQFPVTVAAKGALGPLPLEFRGTTKTRGRILPTTRIPHP